MKDDGRKFTGFPVNLRVDLLFFYENSMKTAGKPVENSMYLKTFFFFLIRVISKRPCALQHSINFPLQHILSVAISNGQDFNRPHRSLFAVCRTATAPPQSQLIYLPMTKEADEVFDLFAQKRLRFFDDLFLRPAL
jgi:hypothetical protein